MCVHFCLPKGPAQAPDPQCGDVARGQAFKAQLFFLKNEERNQRIRQGHQTIIERDNVTGRD